MGLAELLFGICRNGSQLEMYDVNFGGTKHMTKRLTIALVAVVLFVLMAVMPVSAAYGPHKVAQNITNSGATVFIGESGLNLSVLQTNNWLNPGTALASNENSISWWGQTSRGNSALGISETGLSLVKTRRPSSL